MSNVTGNKNVREVPVRIHASVSATISLEDGETLQDVKARHVDIYLHGAGEQGHVNKQDLGADTYQIVTDDSAEMALVNKGLLLALIDTAKRSTDLEAVYDDERGTHYNWDFIEELIDGLDAPRS